MKEQPARAGGQEDHTKQVEPKREKNKTKGSSEPEHSQTQN